MRYPELRMVAVAMTFFLAATGLAGQEEEEECDSSSNVSECWADIRDTAAAEDQEDAEEQISDEVVEANPGASPTVPGAAATVADFLSRMRLSMDSGGLGEGDDEALVFELNDFLGLPTDNGYKLQALVRNPKLSEELAAELADAERVAELEKGLNDFDDVSIVATYSPMGKTLGRKPSLHAAEQSLLFEAIRSQVSGSTDELFAKQFELIDVVDSLPVPAQELIEEKGVEASLESLEPEESAMLQAAFKAALGSRESRREALREKLDENHFFAFADLIANQPQLYVNVEAASPNRLIGPKMMGGKLTYEGSWVNVNTLREECPFKPAVAGETAEQQATRETAFLTCYTEYMTLERRAAAERGDRYSFALEYLDVDDLKPLADLDFTLPADYKLMINASLGRYLTFFEDGAGRSRVDFEGKYEDFGDDPNRQERQVYTLTFAQQVADQAVFTVGFVYADKPEFRGDVDEEISARFGFNYRLLRKGEI